VSLQACFESPSYYRRAGPLDPADLGVITIIIIIIMIIEKITFLVWDEG
jgi:hypothetical protein